MQHYFLTPFDYIENPIYGLLQYKCQKAGKKSHYFNSVSQEEYNSLYGIQKMGIPQNDIIKLTVKAEISRALLMTEREIKIPDLVYIIDNYDTCRSVNASGGESNNNMNESTYYIVSYVLFNSSDISDENLCEIYQDAKIIMSCKDVFGRYYKEEKYVGELMKQTILDKKKRLPQSKF